MAGFLPPLDYSSLSSPQKEFYDETSSLSEKSFKKSGEIFTYKDSSERLLGPWNICIRTPALGRKIFEALAELAQLKGFPPRCRETCILSVGSVYKAVYEIYAHEDVATKVAHLSPEQNKKLINGECPENLSEQEKLAYRLTHELLGKGPIRQESWDEGVKAFGEEGMLALVHYTGFYAYTCVMLNGTGTRLPEGEKLQ